MPQSIHWYVRKMPQLKIWSVSVKITILRFCMDCRSQGRQSGTPPEQNPFFRLNPTYSGINVPDIEEAELGCQWELPLWIEGHWACRCTAGTDPLHPGEKFKIKNQNWDCWPNSRRLHGAAWQYQGRPLQTIPLLPPRSAGWCLMLRSKRPSCLQSEQT